MLWYGFGRVYNGGIVCGVIVQGMELGKRKASATGMFLVLIRSMVEVTIEVDCQQDCSSR